MLEVAIGSDKKIQVEKQQNDLLLDGVSSKYQVSKLSESSYKVFTDTKIYDIQIVSRDKKEMTLSINNQIIDVKVTDHIDQILEKLGMDTAQSNVVKEIKAPMPGSILNILAEAGQEVKAGDQLLILEAMKMENVIKSPGDGIVAKIHVDEKQSVEKNQVLISFE